MLDTKPATIAYGHTQAVEVNKVLRNTYALLGLTLLFSALTAGISMAFNLPHPGFLITLVGYFGLLFLTQYLRNSVWVSSR
jgi:modulator of FtsH protease